MDEHDDLRRRVAASAAAPPRDAVVRSRMVVDAAALELWAGRVEATSGLRVTALDAVASTMARALVAAPSLNAVVRAGRPVERRGVAVTVVDQLGATARLDDADLLSLEELAEVVRDGLADDGWAPVSGVLAHVPAWLLRPVLALVALLGRWGTGLGDRLAPAAHGGAVVEVGAGFDAQWAPLPPGVGVHVLVGPVVDRVVARAGEPTVRPTMSLDVTVDGRLVAGDELVVLSEVLRGTLEDPWVLGGAPRPSGGDGRVVRGARRAPADPEGAAG